MCLALTVIYLIFSIVRSLYWLLGLAIVSAFLGIVIAPLIKGEPGMED